MIASVSTGAHVVDSRLRRWRPLDAGAAAAAACAPSIAAAAEAPDAEQPQPAHGLASRDDPVGMVLGDLLGEVALELGHVPSRTWIYDNLSSQTSYACAHAMDRSATQRRATNTATVRAGTENDPSRAVAPRTTASPPCACTGCSA